MGIDGDNFNIVDGKIKFSKEEKNNLENFIVRWEKKIKQINRMCLDNDQSYKVLMDYLEEWDKFMHLKLSSVLKQLSHDLYLAVIQANNNYRKDFPSFLQIFQKLKLPDNIHFHSK
jgi:hypothetical protein